jgi:hypothetical protein
MFEEGEVNPVICKIDSEIGDRLEPIVFDAVSRQYGDTLPVGWRESAEVTRLKVEGPCLEADIYLPDEFNTYTIVENQND